MSYGFLTLTNIYDDSGTNGQRGSMGLNVCKLFVISDILKALNENVI